MAKKPTEENVEITPANDINEPKRPRILQKEVTDKGVKITVVGGKRGEMDFPLADLPEEIRTVKLPAAGLSHKLGDSAAGKSGEEAEEAIIKTYQALAKGDWSFRVPAQPKISLKDVAEKFTGLSDDEKAAAKALFEQLGFKIPGVTS